MGREFELKYAATEESQNAILEHFSGFSFCEMRTDYYDTADGSLSAQHITLRRRMENGKPVCTLKTPEAGAGRGEWEMECGDISVAAPILAEKAGRQDLLPMPELEKVCGAAFTRRFSTIVLSGCTVELAVDRGILLGGGKELPLCEVEVELKEGSEEICVSFAQELARKFGLTPEKKSKFKRALALAKGDGLSRQ